MTGSVSLAAVRAAVDLLCEAWAPPGQPGRIDMSGDLEPPGSPDVPCSCAADAEPGRQPACGHTSLCICTQCMHTDHVQPATCGFAGCGQPTQLQITPWSLHPGESRAGDAEHDPLTDSERTVVVGDRRQLHAPQFACGPRHAVHLIEDDRKHHQDDLADNAEAGRLSGRFYETQMWQYEPDHVDVPGRSAILKFPRLEGFAIT